MFAHGADGIVTRGETLIELIESTYAGLPAAPRRDAGADDLHLRRLLADRDARPEVRHPLRRLRLADLRGQPDARRKRGQPRPPPAEERRSEETGWHGYALFTEAALPRLDVAAGGRAHVGTETTTISATSPCAAFDLDERLHALQAEPAEPRRVHWSATLDLPIAPHEVWQWLNDPGLRSRWIGDLVEVTLPDGMRNRPRRRDPMPPWRQRDRPHDRRLAAVLVLQ